MFYPEPMTQIEIVVPEQHVLAATNVVAESGMFHQVDASYLSSETGLGTTEDWSKKSTAAAALERRLLAVMKTLGIKEGSPPADLASMTDVEAVQPMAERLEQQVEGVIEDLSDEQKKLEKLQNYVRQLEPIADVSIQVGALKNPRYVFSVLGIIPVEHVQRLRTSLEHIPALLLPLRQDSRRAVVVLSGTQQHADILERAARSAYLSPLNLPDDYQGTPREVIAALRTDIEHMQTQIADQKGVIAELRESRGEQLQTLLWRARASRMLADALARYGRLRYMYVIVGWVPTRGLDALTSRLRHISGEILIEAIPSTRGRADTNVPVALRNPGILHAFQRLVTIYGRPRYEEVDPTLFLALTFPLLFGAMFGDVGHGLVLALLGELLVSRKVSRLRGLADLGVVVTICGVVSIGFGFLYGSVFGMEDLLPALWIRPMENIMLILSLAIGAGVVLLTLGFLTGILNAWLARDWGRLFFGHTGIAGLLLYWSLIGLAAGLLIPGLPVPHLVPVLLAAVSGLAVMFSDLLTRLVEGRRPLIEGGLATYAVQVVFELFEALISLLSNSLSYVRVGAFAVAHAGLSAVIFILAAMVSPARGVVYWVVVALGNLFVIGFEGMIVGIQTLRLEYYEFFSKFFTGGGARYVPLATLPKIGE